MIAGANEWLIDVICLGAALSHFADERDWQGHYFPENLAMVLTGKMGELQKPF